MQANDWSAVIDKLAEKLSVPAAQLWAVLVRQARIDVIEAGVWLVVSTAVAVYLATAGFRRVKTWVDADTRSFSDRDMIWAPFGMAAIASLIGIGVNLPIVATGLLNPEFLALKYILAAAK